MFPYDTVLTLTDTVEANEEGTLRGGPRETWRRLALPLAQRGAALTHLFHGADWLHLRNEAWIPVALQDSAICAMGTK